MQYKNLFKILLGVASFFTFTVVSFANSVSIEAYAQNSYSGMDVLLTSSKVDAYTDIVFQVETPTGQSLSISSKTNENGVAKAKLYSEYTKVSGIYRLSARYSSEISSGKVSFFNVFSSEFSNEKSLVSPSEYLASSGETVKIDVVLRDVNNNNISNRLVKIVPSVDGLVYDSSSVLTDSNGLASFYVSSNLEKAFYISVLDVASGSVLTNRSKIAFIAENNQIASAVGNSSGPASYLEFENIPDNIGILEYLSLTISAYDSDDQLVNDYKGKLRFSVLSNNAENVLLPADYAFVTSDQGSHTFALALLFKTPGTYKLEVKDLSDSNLKGEIELVVSDSEIVAIGDSSIILESPLAGTYNSNIQTISGVSQPAAKLKIFDNNILLTSLISDFEGKFSYTSNPLVNGSHNLYVAAYDNNDLETDRSIEVMFTVDTEAPQILSETLLPEGDVVGGSDITYSFSSDKQLNLAKVYFNDVIYDMVSGEDNFYSISFKAPLIAGNYVLGVEIRDSLNNELKIPAKFEINVLEADSTMKTIENLTATGADRRVILTWDNPENLDEISFYRVYYGTSPDELVNAVDTFTSSNTWYIPNLQNGLRYYFKVLAVGLNGDTSPDLSNVSSAEPVLNLADMESPDVLHGVAGNEILNELGADVSNTGPGLNILLVLTFCFSILFHFRKKIYFK